MRLLALDTATLSATVAVCDGARVLAEREREVTTHSEGLLTLIDEVLGAAGLSPAELDALVCGRGPGSFTGLRIGLATVKGLCLASGRPLICVPSMVGIAAGVAERAAAGALVAVVLDARRDQVFCGLFRDGQPVEPEVLLAPSELRAYIGGDPAAVLAGDGALRYHAEHLADLPLAPSDCHRIHARHLCTHALGRALAGDFDDLDRAVPHYIRGPDVRPPKLAPSAEPLAELSDEQREQLIERLRQTGLRLDRDGRWWHEGRVVEHRGLDRALHRWIDRLDDGRFIIRLDAARYAYVDVDDAPYLVRTVLFAPGDGESLPTLQLSDESREPLAVETLEVGAGDALYCRVKSGRFRARFSRQAQSLLADRIDEADGGFVFCDGARRVPIKCGTRAGV